METKSIRVSLFNHERLADIGHKNDSFNDIIADKEFANGEGVHFSSLDELDAYLDD